MITLPDELVGVPIIVDRHMPLEMRDPEGARGDVVPHLGTMIRGVLHMHPLRFAQLRGVIPFLCRPTKLELARWADDGGAS